MPIGRAAVLASAVAVVALGAGCKGRFRLPADARFVVQIAMGDGFACARMKDTSVRCWGANESGELGDGTTSPRAEAVGATVVPKGVSSVAAGGKHACALGPVGEVICWGAQHVGASPPAQAKTLALGAEHACALTAAGDVVCWGANDAGQLGGVPGTPVVHGVAAIAAGGGATCAIALDRTVRCWGRVPGRGVVGVTRIEGLADVTQIAVSDTHACAVLAWGGVACWGRNEEGELGDGSFADHADAVDVTDLVTPAQAVAVGRAHTCALLRDATVHCWGANARTQLSNGTTAHRATPVLVNGMFEVQELAAAGDATCGRFPDGAERCWGGISLPKTQGTDLPVPTEVRW